MRVIGTAGHVDHGKSTLIKRLTSIDPDRLVEEQARKMTIDLGFAWLEMPSGETVGIVDVPGHRDFIENMLAGVGGIDAVLLIIAADEGVMPQTREHLAILDLLGIENGLILLTKIDMVDDPDWIDLIEQDVLEVIANTRLANADILRVSAHTGDGIDELIEKLDSLLTTIPQRPDSNNPRLPIDRVFTISGFGTVVTGTLLGGALRIGDDIELQPSGFQGRIRGLQSYKQQVDIAYAGSRVAVNITGIEKSAVKRGDVLTHRDRLRSTLLTDVYFQHLPDAERPLKHNSEVKFFSGTSETVARVRLLNDDQLAPDDSGWLQLRLDQPTPLSQGDRFIMRYPSPAQTIGGGIVVNPQPGRRWKRFQSQIIAQLETRMQGTPAQRVAQMAESTEPIKRVHLQKSTDYGDNDLDSAIHNAIEEGLLIELQTGQYMAMVSATALLNQMTQILMTFHQNHPLRLGISREEIRSRLGIKNKTLSLLLTQQNDIVIYNDLLKLNQHEIHFSEAQHQHIEVLMAQIHDQPYTPPSYTEAVEIVGRDVLHALIDLDEIVQVQPEVIFTHEVYIEMIRGVLEIIDNVGQIDAKNLRDRFNTSRKYAIALLEHLDTLNITRRVGDNRVRGRVNPFEET